MTMDITLLASFTAGLLTFLSPCVLPMVPLYLGYLGFSTKPDRIRQYSFLNTIIFCFGFSVIFISLGVAASSVGYFLNEYRLWISRILGIFLMIFGIHMLDIFTFKFLTHQKQMEGPKKIEGFATAFFFGVAFAIGWTPCVGPILSGVLGLAAVKATMGKGVSLLLFYSLGLSFPFIVLSLLFEELSPVLNIFKIYSGKIEKICGLLLFEVGVYLLRL